MKTLRIINEIHDCAGCMFEEYFTGSVCDNDNQIVKGKEVNCVVSGIIYKKVEVDKTMITEPESINFYTGHGVCGTLYKEDNIMKFKGDLDKSAKALFEYVCKIWNEEN